MHGFIPFHSFRDVTRGLYQSWLFSTLSKSRVCHLDKFPCQDNAHVTFDLDDLVEITYTWLPVNRVGATHSGVYSILDTWCYKNSCQLTQGRTGIAPDCPQLPRVAISRPQTTNFSLGLICHTPMMALMITVQNAPRWTMMTMTKVFGLWTPTSLLITQQKLMPGQSLKILRMGLKHSLKRSSMCNVVQASQPGHHSTVWQTGTVSMASSVRG